MIVVADTSPICYLILIGEIKVIYSLFDSLYLPQAVYDELNDEGTPQVVKEWLQQLPQQVRVIASSEIKVASLSHLHRGEYEAILLAETIQAELIIIDDKAGRKSAKQRGLNVTGLLGVLKLASTKNLVDFTTAIEQLKATDFRVSPSLLQSLLEQ